MKWILEWLLRFNTTKDHQSHHADLDDDDEDDDDEDDEWDTSLG